MKFIYFLTASVLCLLFASSCGKDGTPEPTTPTDPKDRITATSLFSQNVGEFYPVKIFIPKEYQENKKLPVLYLLDGLQVYDGHTFFDEVVLSMEAVKLNAILVAIGDKTGLERAKDFVAPGCGGEEVSFNNFYKFITQEVVPYIDRAYESDHSLRTLIGWSHGGNFAYNVFLREQPDQIIFHGFISVDPSNCPLSVIEEHLNNMDFPKDTKFKIHFSQTAFGVAEEIYNSFAAKDFPFLELDFELYANETHESVTIPSIQRGLKFIYGL